MLRGVAGRGPAPLRPANGQVNLAVAMLRQKQMVASKSAASASAALTPSLVTPLSGWLSLGMKEVLFFCQSWLAAAEGESSEDDN